jgi:hypothetical protein
MVRLQMANLSQNVIVESGSATLPRGHTIYHAGGSQEGNAEGAGSPAATEQREERSMRTIDTSAQTSDEWVPVFTGRGVALHLVEEVLRSRGISVVHLPSDEAGAFSLGVVGAEGFREFTLAVPSADAEARRSEIQAAIDETLEAGGADLSAVAEAEQDYDVRACPSCRRFFAQRFGACPGTGEELVPGVECLDPDRSEPATMVVGAGSAAVVREALARLQAAGITAAAEHPAGWTVSLVSVPWSDWLERGAEAEHLASTD